MKHLLYILTLTAIAATIAKANDVPAVHHNIFYKPDGSLVYVTPEGDTIPAQPETETITLDAMRSMPVGTEEGLLFELIGPEFNGTIYYGSIPQTSDVRYPCTILFRSATIDSGRAHIDIKNRMVGKYDILGWQKTGRLHLGYRIKDESGLLLYDGRLRLTGTGPFTVDTSIIEGPFINLVTHNSAVVSFTTNVSARCTVRVGDRMFSDLTPTLHHEIALTDLAPNLRHKYTVIAGPYKETYDFRTAPKPGSRLPFTFAYASDGRGNYGGGERNLRGVNAYILKKIGAISAQKDIAFFQFTGDLIDGYTNSEGRINLEYANWKRTIEPFAHYIPYIAAFGNHEVLVHIFPTEKGRVRVNKFPYETHSSEVVFARNFVNPHMGPASEDGTEYDPDPKTTDFPPYDETVFYYSWDNIAMVVLNSNYWFAPSIEWEPSTGGNLHGYIMDRQLAWLRETLGMLEENDDIDHVFVTFHTPVFPNGGHVDDDMWYSGSNDPRPTIAGTPVSTGIIERRDQLLEIIMHHSSKVKATLTGDEHNYSLLKVTADMPMYPDGWGGPRLDSIREFWHINNGAAGAPYYGREETPWGDHVLKFSTQNAVVFFRVDGNRVLVEVINPDTLELIDKFEL